MLNLVLIPSHGLEGAAIATLVAFFVSMMVSFYLGGKVFPLPGLHPEISKVVGATCLMAMALLFVRQWAGLAGLLGQVFIGVLVYGLALWLMNIADVRSKFQSAYSSKG